MTTNEVIRHARIFSEDAEKLMLPPGLKELLTEIADRLELLNNAHSIQCSSCAHWDTVSGLSARMCDEWQKFTIQREFCSRWRATKGM